MSNSCPSSEWQQIDAYLRLIWASIPSNYNQSDVAGVSPAAIEFTGKASLRSFVAQEGSSSDPLTGSPNLTTTLVSSTTQQSTIADALVNTAAIWSNALYYAQSPGFGVSLADEQTAVHTIKGGYFQPYSTATCVRDSIMAPNDSRPVSFPLAASVLNPPVPNSLRNTTHYVNGVPVLDYPPLQREQLLKMNGSSLDYRVGWFELPSSYFELSSLGVVIILPRGYDLADNTRQSVVVCNLGAGWGSSSINTTNLNTGLTATSSLVNANSSAFPNSDPPNAGVELSWANDYQSFVNQEVAYAPPVFPNTMIEIHKDWAEYLNPYIPSLNSTVINHMMQINTEGSLAEIVDLQAEWVLGSLLTNGLARVGGDFQLQGTPRLIRGPNHTFEPDGTYWVSGKGDFFTADPKESANWLELRVESTIQGYAYNTRGNGPKIAIAILLTYCALAFSYTVYTTISGRLITSPVDIVPGLNPH